MASLEGRYLYVNRAWEEFSRIPSRQALGRLTGEMYSPETARRLKEANRRVVESGAPLDIEEVVEAADGVHYYHTVKFPLRNAQGVLVAVGGVSIEVTERRRAEEAVRAAEARNRELLDASPDGVAVVRNLELAYANQALCDLLGYERPGQLLGRRTTDLVSDASKDRVTDNARARALGRPAPPTYEVECLRRDGRVVPVEVHVRRIQFDGEPSSLAHIRDITERRKSQTALSESEARLRRFFEAAFEAVVLHENGVILDANQAAADLFRCSIADMIGHGALEFAAPDSRETVRGRIADADERHV